MAAGGGLLLSTLPIGASAYAAGSERLNVAVVGCGGRGTGVANQALQADEEVKIVALTDAFRGRLDDCYERLSQRYADSDRLDVPEERKFTGFEAYRNAIDLYDQIKQNADRMVGIVKDVPTR